MSELLVYKQLTTGTKEVFDVLRQEIGMKTNCGPFALKLITAMKSLYIKTEDAALKATDALLSGLQTLYQGGITPEDYDKIDFVKRGGVIVPSARVEAFLRAATRKGYRIFDTIVAVPQEDADSTYFREVFQNNDIVYVLEDSRLNPDRAITAERLINKYFSKFLLRLDIQDAKSGKRVTMLTCEMSIDEMLMVSMVSEQGIFKSRWVEQPGTTKKKKEFSNELNTGTIWINWTGEMVKKTIIRRALKRVKEVLPELTNTIYAFEQDEFIEETPIIQKEKPAIKIPIKEEKRDLKHPTPEQVKEKEEIQDIWCEVPKYAEVTADEILKDLQDGKTAQEILKDKYTTVLALTGSKHWSKVAKYFNEEG